MVHFVAFGTVDFGNLFGAAELAAPGQWDCDGQEAASFLVNNPNNVDFIITGSGFTYAPGNDPPLTGTIETITAEDDDTNPDTTIWQMTGLSIVILSTGLVIPAIADLFAGDDTITGSAGNDVLNGFAGNDIVSGGAGNDELSGDDGNDAVHGDDGDDDIGGAAGKDKVFGDDGNDNHSRRRRPMTSSSAA